MPRTAPAPYRWDEAPAIDIGCAINEVGVVLAPSGWRVLVTATGEDGERVGILLRLADADAIAEAANLVRSGRLADA